MTLLRALNISVSLDGYMAGPDQSLDNPKGVGGGPLHDWVFATAYGMDMIGAKGGRPPRTKDDELLESAFDNIGANIMGRNMFGPVRGEWGDSDWQGWWGPNPPYHSDTYVLTHHAHDPIVMEGGTTFYFVTDGIESALKQARASAGDKDIRLNGGASTIRQFMEAGLLDELVLNITPTLLGGGERLFESLGSLATDWDCEMVASSPAAAHARLVQR